MRLLVPALLLVPRVALADALTLAWDAPPGCPGEAEVRAAASSGSPGASGAVVASGTVERTTTGYRLVLRMRAGVATGERTLEAPTCQGLADAAAVVLGLALASREGATAPPAAPAPDAALSPDAARSPTRERGAPPRPGRAPQLALGLAAGFAPSLLPTATVGGALSAAWTPGRWRVEADGRRWAGASATVAGSPAGARFGLTTVGLRGCATLGRQASVAPCLGVDAAIVTARGFGADANYDRTTTWATLTGGALLRARLTPWLALRARPEALASLGRPRFVVDGAGTVHRPATLGLAATLGAELTLL